MGDIYFGLLVVVLSAAVLFRIGHACGWYFSTERANLLAALTLIGIAVYLTCLWDQVALTRLLPVSSVIVMGNWLPMAAGYLSGLSVAQATRRDLRLRLLGLGLPVAAMATVIGPLMGTAPRCQDVWDDNGVCMQTTDKTCSAASAATLLKCYGIQATEQEMAELCLTRDGTSWMGLYRGLKQKTEKTAWDVEAFECSAAELPSRSRPVIVCVGLTRHANASIHQTEFGWKPGARHAVVLLDFIAGKLVDVADPSPNIGRERWTVEDLADLYRGQGMRLVRRVE